MHVKKIYLSRIPLLLEGLVTFCSTEHERFTVIANKAHSMTRIDWWTTKRAGFYSHFIKL